MIRHPILSEYFLHKVDTELYPSFLQVEKEEDVHGRI